MNGIWTDLFFFLLLFSGRDTGKFQWACPVNSSVFPPSFHSFSINVSLPDHISVLFSLSLSIYMYIPTYQGNVLILDISTSDCRGLVWPIYPLLSASFWFSALISTFLLSHSPVLLLQCSVSLLLGWPLRKPWARSAALLTLTLGLPVAQRASGKFSSLGALAWGAECMYVFMEF